MKQLSPAKLKRPLLRKPGSERGAGEWVEISWQQALDTLTERLQKIRAGDPNQLAFFTGRDQMQALTGLWAQQFGTMNWSAHGGFCSVNMAAAQRQPACVLTCPTSARLFGDFDDPESTVSVAVRERSGFQSLPELGYNPTNHYLPPRNPQRQPVAAGAGEQDLSLSEKLKRWVGQLGGAR